MVTKLVNYFAAAGLVAAMAAPVFAHHSFAAEFDAKRPVKLRGTVVKMEWINLHSWIHIDVKDPTDGEGRAVDDRRRRTERPVASRLDEELAARGHRDSGRGIPGQGRREPRQRSRHHVPGREKALRRFFRHGRA